MEFFRLAKIEELDEIYKICLLIKEDYKKKNINNLWDEHYPTKEIFADDINNNDLYVYIINDEIVGATSITDTFIDLKKEKTKYGSRLMVKPHLQNQGIGTKIIKATEGEMIRQGVENFEFLVSRDNPKAIDLYLRLGCVNLGHYKTPWDAEGDYYYLFSKSLKK